MNKFVLFITIYLFSINLLFSQQLYNIDSIEQKLALIEKDSVRLRVLLEASEYFTQKKPLEAFDFGERAYQLAKATGKSTDIVTSATNLINQYINNYEYLKAVHLLDSMITLADDEKLSLHLADLYERNAFMYSEMDMLDKSIEYYKKSKDLYEKEKDFVGVLEVLNGISLVYSKKGDIDKGLEYNFHVKDLAEKTNNYYFIARTLNNISSSYNKIKRHREAIENLNKALEVNKKTGDARLQFYIYLNFYNSYNGLKDYKKSFFWLQKLDSFSKKVDDGFISSYAKYHRGQYYLITGDKKKALEEFLKAYKTSEQSNILTAEYSSALKISNLYLQQNDTVNHNKYKLISFKVNGKLNAKQNKKQFEIFEIQHELKKNKEINKVKQNLNNIVIILLVIAVILVVFWIYTFRSRFKERAKVEKLIKVKLKEDLEHKNKELTLKVMSDIKRNEILNEISKDLLIIRDNTSDSKIKNALNRVQRHITKNRNDDKIWKEFEYLFGQVNDNFYDRLTKKFPNLTSNELRLSALLKLKMTSKEIATLTGQSLNAIETARYRLRKKMNLSNSEINLISYILKI